MCFKIGQSVGRNGLFSQFVLQKIPKSSIYCSLSSVRHVVEKVNGSRDGWMKDLGKIQNFAAVEDSKSNEKRTVAASSPAILTYTGNTTLRITSQLHIFTPEKDAPRGSWPIFRLMVSLKSWGLQ